jgi:rubrerythrin
MHTCHRYSQTVSNTPERKARRSEVMHCGHASHAARTQVALRRNGHNLVNDEVRRLYRVLEEDRHSQVENPPPLFSGCAYTGGLYGDIRARHSRQVLLSIRKICTCVNTTRQAHTKAMAHSTSAKSYEAHREIRAHVRRQTEYELQNRRPRRRVYKAIQQKIRWTCGECGSAFLMKGGCPECGHQRCEGCIRSP